MVAVARNGWFTRALARSVTARMAPQTTAQGTGLEEAARLAPAWARLEARHLRSQEARPAAPDWLRPV